MAQHEKQHRDRRHVSHRLSVARTRIGMDLNSRLSVDTHTSAARTDASTDTAVSCRLSPTPRHTSFHERGRRKHKSSDSRSAFDRRRSPTPSTRDPPSQAAHETHTDVNTAANTQNREFDRSKQRRTYSNHTSNTQSNRGRRQSCARESVDQNFRAQHHLSGTDHTMRPNGSGDSDPAQWTAFAGARALEEMCVPGVQLPTPVVFPFPNYRVPVIAPDDRPNSCVFSDVILEQSSVDEDTRAVTNILERRGKTFARNTDLLHLADCMRWYLATVIRTSHIPLIVGSIKGSFATQSVVVREAAQDIMYYFVAISVSRDSRRIVTGFATDVNKVVLNQMSRAYFALRRARASQDTAMSLVRTELGGSIPYVQQEEVFVAAEHWVSAYKRRKSIRELVHSVHDDMTRCQKDVQLAYTLFDRPRKDTGRCDNLYHEFDNTSSSYDSSHDSGSSSDDSDSDTSSSSSARDAKHKRPFCSSDSRGSRSGTQSRSTSPTSRPASRSPSRSSSTSPSRTRSKSNSNPDLEPDTGRFMHSSKRRSVSTGSRGCAQDNLSDSHIPPMSELHSTTLGDGEQHTVEESEACLDVSGVSKATVNADVSYAPVTVDMLRRLLMDNCDDEDCTPTGDEPAEQDASVSNMRTSEYEGHDTTRPDGDFTELVQRAAIVAFTGGERTRALDVGEKRILHWLREHVFPRLDNAQRDMREQDAIRYLKFEARQPIAARLITY